MLKTLYAIKQTFVSQKHYKTFFKNYFQKLFFSFQKQLPNKGQIF